MSEERFFFHTDCKDPSCQFVAFKDEERASITNNDDCCGDTETGFGAIVTVKITRDEAKRLADTIMAWLGSNTPAKPPAEGGSDSAQS